MEISPYLASKIGICAKPNETVNSELITPLLKGRIEIHSPGPGVHLYILELFSDRDIETWVSMGTSTAVFSFIMSGYCRQNIQRINGHSGYIDFNAGRKIICTFQKERTRFDLAGGHNHKIVDLQIDPVKVDGLRHYFDSGKCGAICKDLLRFGGSRWNVSTVLTPQIESIISQILYCRFKGAARDLFMKAKSLELLALELNTLESRRRTQTESTEREHERFELARHILRSEFRSPPSLIQLARRVGLNDYKLKLGFRKMYNTTVYGYIRELRMQQAWHLLENEGFSVGEAALEVGYQNFGHFSQAFKKHFGVLPSSVHT